MDFIDQIRAISQRAEKQLRRIKTEEATKNALVMPFINALGYNVFDPTEVIPEFTADVGVKKGEKVDYAIMKDGKVIVLVECKAANVELEDVHTSQLYRYFSVTDARIAVLTNGLDYRFYSDLEEPNRMDSKAFLEFNLLDFPDSVVPELKKLTQPRFDIDTILSTAGDLKYTKEMTATVYAVQYTGTSLADAEDFYERYIYRRDSEYRPVAFEIKDALDASCIVLVDIQEKDFDPASRRDRNARFYVRHGQWFMNADHEKFDSHHMREHDPTQHGYTKVEPFVPEEPEPDPRDPNPDE